MRFKEPLNDVLGKSIKLKILRCLILKGVELTGRQIAEEASASPPSAHKALKELAQAHVIIQKRAGRAILFRLNHENYLSQEMLQPLFKKEAIILKLAIEALLKRIRVPFISLILYGSSVQNKETPGSDIDLLVIVAPNDKKKMEEAFDMVSSDFMGKYGRMLSPHIISTGEFQEKYRKRSPFMVEIVKTGVVIKGKLISQLLIHGR